MANPFLPLLRQLRRALETQGKSPPPDAQLLERWLEQKDESAFELLLWRHGPLVLGVCRRLLQTTHEVEDAFQATFLILVRKAGTLRNRGSLASWLYKVAYRVACRLRASSARRAGRQEAAVDVPDTSPDDVSWREVREVLDDEVRRLPERYRSAFILCYLQGKTNAQAAEELGCPVGTILSRLSWARERLRVRLVRRGITSAGSVLAMLLTRGAEAAVSPALVAATGRLAQGWGIAGAAVEAKSGAVSLAKGVLTTMATTRLVMVLAAVLGLGLLGATVGWSYRTQAGEPEEEQPVMPEAQAPSGPARPKELVEVPSEHDGKLLFIATEVHLGEKLPTGEELKKKIREGKLIEGSLGRLVVEEPHPEKLPEDQQVRFSDRPGKIYRYYRQGEALIPETVTVDIKPRLFRKLEVGDKVQEGDLLALVNPDLALEDLQITIDKFDSAEADRRASAKTRDEAKKRYDAMVTARRIQPRSISDDEFSGGGLTWQRYIEEANAKAAAVRVAGREVRRSLAVLRMHEIHSPANGIIRAIYKKRGEAVKNLESVFQIEITEDDK